MKHSETHTINHFFKAEMRFSGIIMTAQGLFMESPDGMEKMTVIKLHGIHRDLRSSSVTTNDRRIKIKAFLQNVCRGSGSPCILAKALKQLDSNGCQYEVSDDGGFFTLKVRPIKGPSSIKIPLIGASKLFFKGPRWYLFTISDLIDLIHLQHNKI